MKLFKLLFLGLSFFAAQVMAQTTSASSLKLSVYSVMVSTSPFCTSPITIFNNAAPTLLDFITKPTLGSSGSPTNPPDGTYNCVIIKMSDNIVFTPVAAAGASCAAGTQYTTDVCTNTSSMTVPNSGVTTACTGTGTVASADIVYMYLTTNANASTGSNAFLQPANVASTNGIKIANPLVVSGNASSKFIVNTANKVGTGGGACGINAPVFDFQ